MRTLRVIALVALMVCSAAARTLMVIVPHEDDEILGFAGIIYSATQAGDAVYVVLVTNGESTGKTTTWTNTRQAETMAATALLGVPSDHVIFLGYPGVLMCDMYDASEPNTVITNYIGGTQTFGGAYGRGGAEWHYYRHGVHADNTRANALADYKEIISAFLPDVIFTVGDWEQNATSHSGSCDHTVVAKLATDAVNALTTASYAPYVYKTVIHDRTGIWPEVGGVAWQPALAWTQLNVFNSPAWASRVEIPVPDVMLDTNQSTNLKARALYLYNSQSAHTLTNWLYSFVRPTEWFWVTTVGVNRTQVSHGIVSGTMR